MVSSPRDLIPRGMFLEEGEENTEKRVHPSCLSPFYLYETFFYYRDLSGYS